MTRRFHHPSIDPFLLALVCAASLGGFLFASLLTFQLGFPLDDAWIHQTYARNLAWQKGPFAVPGQASAGSTAPLWSGLLALGYVFSGSPYLWTFFLGWALLWAVALTASYIFRMLCPARPGWALWAGVWLALEWHLVWAAGSGMETLLFALFVLIILGWVASERGSWLWLGVLIGLSAWVRPDGITLVGPVMLAALLVEQGWRRRVRAVVFTLAGAAILFVPYLIFNQSLAGSWWPNTFFAKQAEYAVYRQIPLWRRYLAQAGLPLIGAGVVLLPGFGIFLYHAMRRRAWGALAGAVWLAGYLLLYAWRLPVTYQHGRYIIPAMPVFFLWGLAGLSMMARPGASRLWQRVLGKTWLVSAGMTLVLFWLIGARGYGRDVAIIESEMVATAHWVEENTRSGEMIAAHDIGALGYYGNRQILDLAGLVSPEVIPFIRDEAQLKIFLDGKGANYLVTFPEWYPDLVRYGARIYTSQGKFSPAAGGENLTVYRWGSP